MTNNKRLIKYPSIEQFRNIVADVNRHYNFVGLDENGVAIYDHTKQKPTITFVGTVKLHGTNACVSGNYGDGLWFQSRDRIISSLSDNAGFAFYGESNKDIFFNMLKEIANKFNIDLNLNTISIFGEWAGSSIQKNVGITNLPKSFFIFGIKITPHVETDEERKNNPAYWVDHIGFKNEDARIFNINDYKTFEIDIDFNRPESVQNKIIEMTLSVEDECPVAKAFGFPNTIGEGIVFSYLNDKGQKISFKSKGTKHASGSKVKTLKPVDDVRIAKLQELADKITPIWRLEQIMTSTFDLLNGGQIDIKRMGEYLKNLMSDIVKEELDIIIENGFEIKDVSKYVSIIAREYFLNEFNNLSNL